MKRNCCLCDAPVDDFMRKPWHLPGMGVHTIAYGVCKNCGMVIASETLSVEDMNTYYKDVATYINPGRAGKPSAEKVRGQDRVTFMVQSVYGHMPKSVFQVGCSDGYTLSRFKDLGVENVSGIELSEASCQLAREQYGIDVILGDFESYTHPDGAIELIVLAHILEHLYDPKAMLRKCHELQDANSALLIEVPLMEEVDRFPPGILTLEHLNYFTERTIRQMVEEGGYRIETTIKDYAISKYPIISMFCKRADAPKAVTYSPDPDVEALVETYLAREAEQWGRAAQAVKGDLSKGTKAYIYAAGIHTTQLLANTDIADHLDIVGVIDSSPTKWGRDLGAYPCIGPDDADPSVEGIVISSFDAENEIYNAIRDRFGDARIVKLYNR